MPAIGLFTDEGGAWARADQESPARRTERFDGGFVVRRRDPHWSAFNLCVPTPGSEQMLAIEHWYEILFVRLARRLRYGGRKAANARKRLTLHWGRCGIPEAMMYARDVRATQAQDRATVRERLTRILFAVSSAS